MAQTTDTSAIRRTPSFDAESLAGHRALLAERIFQTETKWPHFDLLLRDIDALVEALPPDATVVSLERGLLYGGISLLAPLFSGHSVVAVDCSPASAETRGAYNKDMVDDPRLCRVESSLRADIQATGLPDEMADLVVVPNLVHHVADQDALFTEIARLVKPGGTAYVFEPLVRELHQIPDDFLRYTPFGMGRIMEAKGLTDVQQETEGGPFSAVAYCWAQALEYFPEAERREMSAWFYSEHFPQLMAWDRTHTENKVRAHTEFPMAFSVRGTKAA